MSHLYNLLALSLALITNSVFAAIKVSTYNIRNYSPEFKMSDFKEKTSKHHLKKVLKGLNSDLIAVQEIVDSKDFAMFVMKELPEYQLKLSACGGTANQKVGFLYKKDILKLKSTSEDLRLSISGKCEKGLRPAFIGEFTHLVTKRDFTAIALHLKAGNSPYSIKVRSRQYEIISEIISDLPVEKQKALVLLGDLNTTGYKKKVGTYNKFKEFLQKSNLVNLSKDIECSAYWWGQVNDKKEYPSQLDHIIVNKELFQNASFHKTKSSTHCEVSKCNVATEKELGLSYKYVSDHCPVSTNL